MVGNVQEWVADWLQGPGVNASTVINVWHPSTFPYSIDKYGNDSIYGINEAFHLEAPQTGGVGDDYEVDGLPAGVARGGHWGYREGAGIYAIAAGHTPSSLDNATGFRCAR